MQRTLWQDKPQTGARLSIGHRTKVGGRGVVSTAGGHRKRLLQCADKSVSRWVCKPFSTAGASLYMLLLHASWA